MAYSKVQKYVIGLDQESSIGMSSDTPLFRQIYARVLDMIASAHLQTGDRVPSSRSLASELGVSRGTVEEAYQLLVAEGYVVRRGAAGSFIAASPPLQGSHDRRSRKMERRAYALTDHPQMNPEGEVAFRMGLPALDHFPRLVWSRQLARQVRRCERRDLWHAGPLGLETLRQAITHYISLARGIACSPENIVITTGFHGALRLAAQIVLPQGSKVWVENPGYPPSRKELTVAGCSLAPVPVDNKGLLVSEGISRFGDARAALVTPSHQFPTCAPMALSRRVELLQWATDNDAWIIEDDYDGEFHYAGRPLPALKSIDQTDRVLYAGSFSKTLYPGLRLGYLVLPAELSPRLEDLLPASGIGPPTLVQRVVSEFIDAGQFVRHLSRMRALYSSRREALEGALGTIFGSRLKLECGNGGLHIIGKLNDGTSDTDVAQRAARIGIDLYRLSKCYVDPEGENGILLPFANVPELAASKLVRKLYEAVQDAL